MSLRRYGIGVQKTLYFGPAALVRWRMPIQTFCVHASPAEQAQLEQVARQGKTPQKVAARARIVLMLANHEPPASVADALHLSRMTVWLWADRFVRDGVPGLVRDASRPGRRKHISPEKIQAVVEATLTTRPPAATHWSSRPLAKAQGLSDGTIRKIWRQHGLQPHRVGRFKLSTDPHFVEKLRDVVGLYLQPPAKAVVFCVDEKSGIQALDRTRPVLPLRPGRPRTTDPRLHPPRHDDVVCRAAGPGRRGDRRMPAPPPQSGVCPIPAAARRRDAHATAAASHLGQFERAQKSRRCDGGLLVIPACIFTSCRPVARG